MGKYESSWGAFVVDPSFSKFGMDSSVLVEYCWMINERCSTLLLRVSTAAFVSINCCCKPAKVENCCERLVT